MDLKLTVDGLGPRTYRVVLDTGSTGLVVVQDDKKSVQVKMANCQDNMPCQSYYNNIFYTQCFADGSGYLYSKKRSTARLTLLKHTAKVGFVQAALVYDPDNTMFQSEVNTYTNVWGLGGHGKKACTAFQKDLLQDFTEGRWLNKQKMDA